jgi:hypothetical protein
MYKLHLLNVCLAQAVLEVVDCVLDSGAAYLNRLADLYAELVHAQDHLTLRYAFNLTLHFQLHLHVVMSF